MRKRTRASLGVSDLVQAGVQQQHAEDWLAVRKAKALPLTATALDQTRAEADLAGLTLDEAVRVAASNSWAGFKAAWVLRPPTGSPGGFVSKQLAIEAHNERVGEEWARKKAIELADQIAQERAEEVRRAGF